MMHKHYALHTLLEVGDGKTMQIMETRGRRLPYLKTC
jgi:hypothetical protein